MPIFAYSGHLAYADAGLQCAQISKMKTQLRDTIFFPYNSSGVWDLGSPEVKSAQPNCNLYMAVLKLNLLALSK